jgi:lysozyme
VVTVETLHFPDLYSGSAGIDFSSSFIAVGKATQGMHYVDPQYTAFQSQAKAKNVYYMAYHFLEQGNGKAQATHAFSVVGPHVALAVDCESYLTSHPRLIDLCDFIDEYKRLGGILYITYLPHWYWQDFWNSPNLSALAVRDQWLWSSNYTNYSDTGPGWKGYGNLQVAIWQYADDIDYGGIQDVDFNAFKGTGKQPSLTGTRAEFQHLVTTGVLTTDIVI